MCPSVKCGAHSAFQSDAGAVLLENPKNRLTKALKIIPTKAPKMTLGLLEP